MIASPSVTPIPKSQISLHFPPQKFVERQVLKLRVKCAHYQTGCEWKGELNYFKSHLQSDCQFVSVLCAHCETTTYLRGQADDHLSQCGDFPLECKQCDTKIRRKHFTVHSERECPNLKMQCPNECGSNIAQSLLQHHVDNTCPCRRVQCLYAPYGCQHSPKYIDLKSHLTRYQVTHLELKVLYLERLVRTLCGLYQ